MGSLEVVKKRKARERTRPVKAAPDPALVLAAMLVEDGDLAAEARAREADQRDGEAVDLVPLYDGAADNRAQAINDRRVAAEDRALAARDREDSGTDALTDVRRREAGLAAQDRDVAAGLRDREAEARDDVARDLDRTAGDRAATERRHAADEGVQAASGRAGAADNRAHAINDRRVAAEDRRQAAKDREDSGADELTGVRRREAGLAARDRDEAAGLRDREAEARDEAARDLDQTAGDRAARNRQRAADEGAQAASGRAEAAAYRAQAINDRKLAAEDRAQAAKDRETAGLEARARDLAAELRDREAEARDDAAGDFDRNAGDRAASNRRRAADDGARADSSRAEAANSRVRAVNDRKVAADDRAQAAKDFEDSETDEVTALRRREAGLAARERDDAAGLRDREAEARDGAAGDFDRTAGDRAASNRQRAADERARADSGRAEAADSRAQAINDRKVAADDRAQAAKDREDSGTDEVTAVRRREAGLAATARDDAAGLRDREAEARDDAERRRTDAVSAEMAAIVDSSNDAIIGKTLEGIVTTWNRGAEYVYGYSAGEMVGKSVSLLVPLGHPDEIRSIIADMLAHDARTEHFETKRMHKSGRVIDVSMTVSPIRDSDGKIVGASSVARDVTEQNAMAEALKASELRSVMAVSRAKDEMVSLVSHELRTPLASLLGFTELLYARDFSAKQQKQYLEVMLREGRRLTDLINDVLHIQRLEAGHQELHLAPADLEMLARRAITTIGTDAQRPIKMHFPETLPLVMIDTDAILQVLGNFLSNARHYSPDGGAILVSGRLVDGMVEIEVADHGLGMPADAISRLFGTFYRIDNGDRRLIKGTGLGLAINRKIVDAHGGQVAGYSDGPGLGSRFTFTLPVPVQSPKAADVLIVEDDSGFARLLQEQLHARGMTTVRTADAETAERLLKAGMKPRAVLADLVLPGLQGEEFVARLGADGGNAMPVVVLTVKSLAPTEIAALEKVGVTAVLPKEAGASQAAVSLITNALVAGSDSG